MKNINHWYTLHGLNLLKNTKVAWIIYIWTCWLYSLLIYIEIYRLNEFNKILFEI